MAITSQSPSRCRRAFTLIELLVVTAIIATLMSILLPALGKAKELANRAYCAANLRGITQSLTFYSQEFDTFPVTKAPLAPNTYLAFSPPGVGLTNRAETTLDMLPTTLPGNVPACVWMLNLRNAAPPKIFLCKSDLSVIVPARNIDSQGLFYDNFQAATQLSYGFSYPWIGSSISPVWRGRDGSSATPIAADMGPLAEVGYKDPSKPRSSSNKSLNSSNHQSEGQNVSYADDHVDFVRSPYVGANEDNIYTVNNTGISSSGGLPIITPGFLPAPVTATDFPYDTVMIPVRSYSGAVGP